MNEIQEKLKQRYSNLHPIVFQRSLEKSKSNGDLFDILDTFPDTYPVFWDNKLRRWVSTDDLLQKKRFSKKLSKKGNDK